MPLLTDDIGQLFSVLQAAYGHQWAHRADAIPVWQAKLQGFTREEIMEAAGTVIERYPDFAVTAGQFLGVLQANRPRVMKRLPPPKFDQANADKAWDYMEKLAGRKLRSDSSARNAASK